MVYFRKTSFSMLDAQVHPKREDGPRCGVEPNSSAGTKIKNSEQRDLLIPLNCLDMTSTR